MGRPRGVKNGHNIDHQCLTCGTKFSNHNTKTKFCCHKCFTNHRRLNEYGTCLKCGKEVEYRQPNGSFRRKKFCGYSCANTSKKPSYYWLGKTRPDVSINQQGEKGNNWQGGKTPINKRIRLSARNDRWRISVFKRDNWMCRRCGVRGGDLRAHHIFNFSTHPKLRFRKSNGITLCHTCHCNFHQKYGYKDNNRQQIDGYLV